MKYTKSYQIIKAIVILILLGILCFGYEPADRRLIDNVPPTLTLKQDISYIMLNEEYDIYAFVEEVYDISNKTEVSFITTQKKDVISFDTVGEHTFMLQALDRSGNCANQFVSVIVNDIPSIVNVRDKVVLVGDEFDAMENVIAVDRLDGTITDNVKVDIGALDCNRIGTYEIEYSITDSCGAKTSKSARVLVCNETLSENYKSLYQHSLTKEELATLYECNYFRYMPLEEPDYDKTLELVLPTLLNLESRKATCSGVILHISPEYVYCISVEHGLEDMTDGAWVTFFNGERIFEHFSYVRLAYNNEISLFRIPISSIPVEELLELKQIHISDNPFYYMNMDEGEPLVLYCANLDPGDVTASPTEMISAYDTFIWQDEELEKDYQFIGTCISAYSKSEKGQSGTAVVDYYGNLAGIVSVTGTVDDVRKDFYLKIDKLEEFESKLAE